MAESIIRFEISPRVIQGGTYEGIDYQGDISIFKLINTYGQTINERQRIYISFEAEYVETNDSITVNVKGVDYFRVVLEPLAQGGTFNARTRLYTDSTDLFDRSYVSGTGTAFDSGNLQGITINQSITIPKTSGRTNVNIKFVRFDDMGELQSADNYIELYLTGIVYVPPPDPDIKPWAIRKGGTFYSLDRPSGKFYIRRGGWQDKSTHKKSKVGKPNEGVARIRKSGTWLGQNKIGN